LFFQIDTIDNKCKPKKDSMNKCAVLIPIYKLPLNKFEILNLDISIGNLLELKWTQ